MRIGFQIERLDPARGGAETYVSQFSRQLLAAGHSVHVFTEEAPNAPADVRVHSVRPYHVEAAARACADQRLDVVVGIGKSLGMNVFQPHGGTFLGSRRQNLALTRNSLARSAKALLNRVVPRRREAVRLERMQYAQTTPRPHFIALSEMVYRDMRQYYGVPPERLHLVYNGVDIEQFSPDRCAALRTPARKQWDLRPGTVCFLLVAHNFRLKGVRELIEATALLGPCGCDFQVVIVGRGNPWPYQILANRLGCRDHIRFAGAMRDVERAYAAADVYVQPTWYDPCSLVVLEAWACGLPVITTRFNGAGELMTDGREGYLLDTPVNTEKLAEQMANMLNAERRVRMGRKGRALAQSHTLEHNFREMVQILELAAQEHRGSFTPVIAQKSGPRPAA